MDWLGRSMRAYNADIVAIGSVAANIQSADGLFQALGTSPDRLSRQRPFYRRLVELVAQGIGDGRIPGGSQLPAERDLAGGLRVSRTTIVTAYRELEARGLVRGYVGRGTFVCARPEPGSAPFAWRGKIASAALQSTPPTVRDIVQAASDRRLINLAAGQPALDQFPIEEFRRVVDRILTRDPIAALGFGPTEGEPQLRAAIARRFGGSPAEVLVVAGAQQGLDLLARCLIDPGDTIIIDRPGYLGAIDSFRAAGARLVGWDVHKSDVDELEEQVLRYKPKFIYLTPTHHNPTGLTMPLRVRKGVLELAARYRLPIVEDDTYRDLSLGRQPPPSLYTLDADHSIVIHLNSFSKALAPGLRLGWINAVPAIIDQLTLIKQRADPLTQNLVQLAVAEFIESGSFDRHLAGLRIEHRKRRDAFLSALAPLSSSKRLQFAVPDGGLFLWCRLSAEVQAPDVLKHARARGVVFVAGAPFYVDPGGAHELRLCYTAEPVERAAVAARVLDESIAAAQAL